MKPDPGIVIRDLHYAYATKSALKGISLHVRGARFTALLGPNGAGKSTLFSLLCGLIASRRGHIEILGIDVSRNRRAALARMGIVFQQQTLDLDLSVRQNMLYFAALRGFSGRQARLRIDASLQRMGLAQREKEKVRSLNSGHRRRLEIARILVHTPSLLLLDEPTVGLDVPSRTALIEHLHNLCTEEHLTILWATHLVDEVWETDDLVVLDEGQVKAAGSVEEVLATTECPDVMGAFSNLIGDHDADGSQARAAS